MGATFSSPHGLRAEPASGAVAGVRHRITARVREVLPRGGSLPRDDWRKRHTGVLALLWLNVLAVAVFVVIGTRPSAVHRIDGCLALVVLAGLGSARSLSRKLRTACASLGLLAAAALLIDDSGGLIEMHFYFFVLIIVLALYEDWTTFMLAVGFVLLHHGLLGTLDPHAVFDRPEQWAHPWKWAAIHSAFVAAAGVAALVTWRLNEDVRAQMRSAQSQLRVASTTDFLTGLANRRKLMADLDRIVASATPAVLVMLDLDGFKAYNDTFGHPAGDALLTRIGARLRAAVAGHGDAYRLGGDEFCSVWFGEVRNGANPELLSAAAMCERGEGFAITGSYGAVSIPGEASSAELALHTADQRLYAHKHGSRSSSVTQSSDVLAQTLVELRPGLAVQIDAVVALAEDVARAMELPAHIVEQIRLGARLHDIGKVAIPDALLESPVALTPQERAFINRHTTIGERIISAAPDLAQVAPLVRSSHERVDGSGYPDGLRGEQIPIGARIIAVCDTFNSLTAPRPGRDAVSSAVAMAELRRCAGTQFDADVVKAFERVLADACPAAQRDVAASAS